MLLLTVNVIDQITRELTGRGVLQWLGWMARSRPRHSARGGRRKGRCRRAEAGEQTAQIVAQAGWDCIAVATD